jgi:hypothetical protein
MIVAGTDRRNIGKVWPRLLTGSTCVAKRATIIEPLRKNRSAITEIKRLAYLGKDSSHSSISKAPCYSINSENTASEMD